MTQAEGAVALRCADWATLLDADAFTDRRVEDLEALSERRIVDAIGQMTSVGMSGIDETWLDFLRQHMQVSAFVAEGTRRALARAERLCADAAAARCLTVQAMMFERQAQAVVLYAMDLSRQLGDLPIETARSNWELAESWAGARDFLADVAACDDWSQIAIALNLCFEPLVGQFVRREFGSNAARAARDTVTPIVAEAGQVEWGWVQHWTVPFVRGLLADEAYGDANREVLSIWVERYTAQAHTAVDTLRELGTGTTWETALSAGLDAVVADQEALLNDAGLEPVPLIRRESTA